MPCLLSTSFYHLSTLITMYDQSKASFARILLTIFMIWRFYKYICWWVPVGGVMGKMSFATSISGVQFNFYCKFTKSFGAESLHCYGDSYSQFSSCRQQVVMCWPFRSFLALPYPAATRTLRWEELNQPSALDSYISLKQERVLAPIMMNIIGDSRWKTTTTTRRGG